MLIDNYYNTVNKSQFYLGLVSELGPNKAVIQIENLTWMHHRKIKNEILIPNTINYYVIIDSVKGLFFGEVCYSKVAKSDSVHKSLADGMDEKVFPELTIDVIGYMSTNSDTFALPGFDNVGLTDKVYIANKKVIDLYFQSIEILNQSSNVEVSLENIGQLSNDLNVSISLKPSTLLNRHLMTIGMTNSGKSTSALAILDKLVQNDKKLLIIDPTGEYSSSFNNDVDCVKLKLGDDTSISTGEIPFSLWEVVFGTNDASQPALLAEAIKSLRYQYKHNLEGLYIKEGEKKQDVLDKLNTLTSEDVTFNLELLSNQIDQEGVKSEKNGRYEIDSFRGDNYVWLKQKVDYKLSTGTFKNFFQNNSENDLIGKLESFLNGEIKRLYINASELGSSDEVGSMIVDLLVENIMKSQEVSPFVFFVDEVHRYTSNMYNLNYKTKLTSIAREGRKKGIFLFLTTQNPNDVPKELLGQIGSLLIHRLTHQLELEAIRNYISKNTLEQIKKLNQGEAILTSTNLLTDIHLKINKSSLHHCNDTPSL